MKNPEITIKKPTLNSKFVAFDNDNQELDHFYFENDRVEVIGCLDNSHIVGYIDERIAYIIVTEEWLEDNNSYFAGIVEDE